MDGLNRIEGLLSKSNHIVPYRHIRFEEDGRTGMYFGLKVSIKRYAINCDTKSDPLRTKEMSEMESEVSSLIMAHHPNIVTCFGVCKFDGLYGVFEAFGQTNFDACLFNGMDFTDKHTILLQVGSALSYLHELPNPIYHNAVKAKNILVNLSTKTAKLSNFSKAIMKGNLIVGGSFGYSTDIYQFGTLIKSCFDIPDDALRKVVKRSLHWNLKKRPTAVEMFDVLERFGKDKPKKPKETDDHSCLICLEAEKNIVCLPCSHLVCCVECSRMMDMNKCILCRSDVEHFIKIYK